MTVKRSESFSRCQRKLRRSGGWRPGDRQAFRGAAWWRAHPPQPSPVQVHHRLRVPHQHAGKLIRILPARTRAGGQVRTRRRRASVLRGVFALEILRPRQPEVVLVGDRRFVAAALGTAFSGIPVIRPQVRRRRAAALPPLRDGTAAKPDRRAQPEGSGVPVVPAPPPGSVGGDAWACCLRRRPRAEHPRRAAPPAAPPA